MINQKLEVKAEFWLCRIKISCW